MASGGPPPLPTDHGVGDTVPDTPFYRCIAAYLEDNPDLVGTHEGFVLEPLTGSRGGFGVRKTPGGTLDFHASEGGWRYHYEFPGLREVEILVDAPCRPPW